MLRAAGSRYTYSANPLAYAEAVSGGAERVALVGMSCQASAPPAMAARRAGKVARRFALTVGLLCSKTFDDAIFAELFEARYGLHREEIVKTNIKGVFQIWTRDGGYHEIPLKEAHAWTREGCRLCPDFAAEHADISAGGIGADNDWTLTIVRTERGAEIIERDARRRCHRGPSGRGRPDGRAAPRQAVPGEPAALARGRRRRPAAPPRRRRLGTARWRGRRAAHAPFR